MKTNRRRFLSGSVSSALALAASQCSAEPAEERSAGDEPPAPARDTQCLDYGCSFICNTAAFNAVRFWIESRTTLTDPQQKRSVEFFQCGSCKSENTFAEQDLFHEDNYDFLPILGDEHWLVFRRPVGLSERYRQVHAISDLWGPPVLKLRYPRRVTVLESFEQIRDYTAAGIPIVSQTEIADEQSGLQAMIECPVKTLNVSLEKSLYQVDTGPIALPDLTRRYDIPVESLSLAFVAFNAPHFADFVKEQPTPVLQEGQEVCQVYHYARPFSMSARNRLLALGSLEDAEP